jgi:hypothetical protein
MKALEFRTRMENNDTIFLPPEIVSRLKAGQQLRVLLLVDEDVNNEEEERAWRELTAKSFFAGYAEGDSIYDRYDELHGR